MLELADIINYIDDNEPCALEWHIIWGFFALECYFICDPKDLPREVLNWLLKEQPPISKAVSDIFHTAKLSSKTKVKILTDWYASDWNKEF